MKSIFLLFSALALVFLPGLSRAEDSLADSGDSPIAEALAIIKAVGREGRGNVEAGRAWKQVSAADSARLPEIFRSMDDAGPLAFNWLRTGVDVIVDREIAAGGALPLTDLGEFLMEVQHRPDARALAYEIIARVDLPTAEALLPGLLHDPSVDLRRGAVQRLIDEAAKTREEGNQDGAALLFRQALGAARDLDQIQEAAKQIRELGRPVDLPRHFGFLMHWNVIGSFDNTGREGFDAVYPPEKEIDFEATYPGKEKEAGWSEYVTSDEYGMVDINEPYGMLKEVVAYAYTEFNSETSRPAELRLGCKNAWKVWVNGEFVFGRDEYHRGMRIDQYRLPVQLDEGKNTILVKLCQDHQTQDWTVEWQFQLRVCDATGTAILAPDRPPTPVAAPPERKRRG